MSELPGNYGRLGAIRDEVGETIKGQFCYHYFAVHEGQAGKIEPFDDVIETQGPVRSAEAYRTVRDHIAQLAGVDAKSFVIQSFTLLYAGGRRMNASRDAIRRERKEAALPKKSIQVVSGAKSSQPRVTVIPWAIKARSTL